MKLTMIILSALLSTTAFAGTELQDGGGGVFKDGRYMTYHTARIPIKNQPATIAQIPGMKLLIERLSAMPVLDAAKSKVLASVIPSGGREYHSVSAEALHPDMRKKINAEYAKIFHCDESEVVLFAVTDPKSKTTALFPEFFQLRETEQAAILFHETLWVLGKSFMYQEVLDLEGAAQEYFENPENEEAVYNFYYKLSKILDQGVKSFLLATLQFDRSHPATNLGGTDGKLLIQDLLGEKWLHCILFGGGKCNDLLLPELLKKSQQNPHSLFRRALVELMTLPDSIIMATKLIGYFGASLSQETIQLTLNEGFYLDANAFGPAMTSSLISFPILAGRKGPKIGLVEFSY